VQAGDVIQGRYELLELLGQGGMAVVWRARDERLERAVAIKLMAPAIAGSPEFLVRFFSEAQNVARISHPNVVSVLDFGEDEGRPFLVMEHLPGGSVADLCGTPLLPERAVEIVAQAAAGAGAAHRGGIVHRDVKPANILLTSDGTAKLADFGIASAAGVEGLTATGAAIGSPHYISPEQAAGKGATPASDVYSLGAVLFELLTGRKLFDDPNVMAIALAHVEREPTAPSALVADLDPGLDALVLRCLDKDPARRFADGGELTQALGALAAEDGAATGLHGRAAPPEPAPGRFRRPWVLAGAAALLIVGSLTAWAVVGGRERPVAQAGTQLPKVSFERRRSPSPTPSAPGSVPVATPSPTASPTPTEDPTPRSKPDEPDPEPTSTPRPTPSTTPSPPPTPTPTPEPTEPTPEPTTAPSPEPTAAP
jgi:serine/threonine protein kinase